MRYSTERAVYRLSREFKDPRFEGFARSPDDDTPLLPRRGIALDGRERDFYPDRPCGMQWRVSPLSAIWRPLKLVGRVRSFNDNPMWWPIPAFSRRAVDALRSFLEPNCEILPIIHPAGEYYLINVLKVADIVDHQKSVVSFIAPTDQHVLCDYDYYHIEPDRLHGLSIFRMRNDWISTYVTTEVVAAVRAAGLNGFVFDKIWPWPAGTRWKTEVRRERHAARASKGIREGEATAQSIVLRLSTGDTRKPTNAQRERVSVMMNSLDALLISYPARIADGYRGAVEGDEAVRGEHRIFFSCPSSERLLDALRPWLRNLDWPHDVSVILRTLPMSEADDKAKECFPPW
jgi:hypothetical protein